MLELPFVVGVMADLSAQAKEENKKQYKKRSFVSIDRDNFNDVMARSAPRLAFRVPDKISGTPDQLMNVELNFKSMKDFDPARVAEQVPVLNDLLTMRKKLTELLSKMEGNDALEKLLADALANTEKRDAILAALGKKDGDAAPTEEKA